MSLEKEYATAVIRVTTADIKTEWVSTRAIIGVHHEKIVGRCSSGLFLCASCFDFFRSCPSTGSIRLFRRTRSECH